MNGGSGAIEQVHDGAGVGGGDDGALGLAGAEEVAEVGGLVVEAVAEDGMVEIDGWAGRWGDRSAGGVPPGFVDRGEAARAGEDGSAGRGEREAGIELREATAVTGLDDGEGVDGLGGA